MAPPKPPPGFVIEEPQSPAPPPPGFVVQPEPVAAPPSNAPRAAGLGFGQGASFGFTDEMAGAVSGLVAGFTRAGLQATKNPVARAAVRKMLGRDDLPDFAIDDVIERAASRGLYESTGFGGPSEKPIPRNPDDALRQGYVRARDEYRADLERAQSANPRAYLAGELAGAVVSPGPKAATGAKGLARAGQLAKAGAAYGAASGVGYGRSDNIESPEQMIMEAGAGAGTGAVVAPVAATLGDKAGRGLRKLSQDQALKAIGLRAGIGSQLERLGYESADEARELGQAALDMELIPRIGKASDVAEAAGFKKAIEGTRIETALQDASKAAAERNALIRAMNESDRLAALAEGKGRPTFPRAETPEFDADRAAWTAAQEVMGPEGLTPTAAREATRAQRLVQDIRDLPIRSESTFANANRMKSDMYAGINYGTDPALKTRLERRAASGLRKSIEEQVAETAGPDVADELRAANRNYGFLQDIQPLAREEASRQLERQSILDPRVVAAALAGSTGGAAVGGAGGSAVGGLLPFIGKALAPYAPATTAHAASWMSRTAPKAATPLARPATQQLSQEEDDAISAFLSGG